jgi:hypothetical protein
MRLIHTSLTAVAVLAVTGTAFAATTRDEVTTDMGGTSRISPGGDLKLIAQRRDGSNFFRVTIRYDVTVRSTTRLGFAVHPCRSTRCNRQSTGTIDLAPGVRHVKFTGRVPVVRSSGRACVFAQVRDQGPRHKRPGQVVRNGGSKGVTLCRTVR